MLTIKDVIKHIKKCDRLQRRYDWLGFTENKDLNPEVESLFSYCGLNGFNGFDWVNGNNKLSNLILVHHKAI